MTRKTNNATTLRGEHVYGKAMRQACAEQSAQSGREVMEG